MIVMYRTASGILLICYYGASYRCRHIEYLMWKAAALLTEESVSSSFSFVPFPCQTPPAFPCCHTSPDTPGTPLLPNTPGYPRHSPNHNYLLVLQKLTMHNNFHKNLQCPTIPYPMHMSLLYPPHPGTYPLICLS